MKIEFSAQEARVIGALLEKQITTPDQYPMSLNGVVTACNQKSNREPVMALSEAKVQQTLDALVKKHHVSTHSGFGSRVAKYEQRFCNSAFGHLQLSSGEVAIITTLLLRGAQTPGELRTRCQRMHEFGDMAETEACLEGLASREAGAMVLRLAREPGKRESRYQHLLGGEIIESVAAMAGEDQASLAERVAQLEAEMSVLKAQLATLLQQQESADE
ncbi:hypothetical protein CIG19_00370 [Enterobacterales bacterium CwR94]|nr:hypothetical protein CIG19_00370 [Enterobacterales bacterium CwR94]